MRAPTRGNRRAAAPRRRSSSPKSRTSPEVGRIETYQHANGRGFARAGWTQEPKDLAAIHPKVEPVHCQPIPQGFGQTRHLQDRLGLRPAGWARHHTVRRES